MSKDINVNFHFAPYYKSFIKDLYKAKHQKYSIYGGRDSAKSTSLYMLELLIVMQEGDVLIVRRYYNTLEGSSYTGIIKQIRKYGLSDLFKITKSPLRITHIPSGRVINFGGLDAETKLNSTESLTGNYALVVYEECQEIEQEKKCAEVNATFNRGEGSDTFRVCYIFNPPANRNHWTNVTLREDKPGYQKSLLVNYLNIPKKWVGKRQLEEIERIKKENPKMYRHRYLGEPLADEDTVFENVETMEITDEQIAEWFRQDEYLFCGMDFGYSPDPNAAVFMKYDPDNRFLYIFREFYKGKLNNKQISDGLEAAGFSKDYLIIADKDEKTINDLRSYGWRIQSAVKGPGSVEEAFKWLQGLNKIIIDDKRCPNAAEEFLLYHYCMDKFGNIKSGYKDTDNQADHIIAGARYGTERLRRRAGA